MNSSGLVLPVLCFNAELAVPVLKLVDVGTFVKPAAQHLHVHLHPPHTASQPGSGPPGTQVPTAEGATTPLPASSRCRAMCAVSPCPMHAPHPTHGLPACRTWSAAARQTAATQASPAAPRRSPGCRAATAWPALRSPSAPLAARRAACSQRSGQSADFHGISAGREPGGLCRLLPCPRPSTLTYCCPAVAASGLTAGPARVAAHPAGCPAHRAPPAGCSRPAPAAAPPAGCRAGPGCAAAAGSRCRPAGWLQGRAG